MRDDPTVIALVTNARDGDKTAWDQIVDRYAPLVWSICMKFQLSRADAEDVGQIVWLRLVERLADLRDPAALPGWLVTTTRRECLQNLQMAERLTRIQDEFAAEARVRPGSAEIDEELLAAERNAALIAGFNQLDQRCQRLLSLTEQRPKVPYETIAAILKVPMGSIGPTRARCLAKLRRCPAVAIQLRSERAEGDERNADAAAVER
jgi:RNA polymerase sigma factor (sigma-70 family)